MIYRAMIRSRLDYGCLVYGSAARTNLAKLDVVQAKALRVCCGAVRTTSIPALLVECGEMPLRLRRVKLAIQCIGRIQSQGQCNPVKQLLVERGETAKRGWGRGCYVKRVWAEFPELGKDMAPRVVWPCVPPWLLPDPEIDWTVKEIFRERGKENPVEVVKDVINENWDGHLQIYTDGSVDPATNRAAFAVHIPEVGLSQGYRIPNNRSVFTTEVIAILCALEWVGKMRPQYTLICSDSAAALMTIQAGMPRVRADLVYEIRMALYRVYKMELSVAFLWVPAHVGIAGNEVADSVAKEALRQEFISVNTTLGFFELCSIVARQVSSEWQREWDAEERGRHYYSIQKSVKGGDANWGRSRGEQVLFARLRLGHCGLAPDLALIGKTASGLCACGRKQESVKHVLMECSFYKEERSRLFKRIFELGFSTISLKTLLGPSTHINEVMAAVREFIYATDLHRKI